MLPAGGSDRVRPVPTLLVGVVGGALVGVTSVGSGTLMLVALGVLYPALGTAELVGTDLIQAVPLVGAAALGHLVGGGLHVSLTTSVVAGGVPGALIGALVLALRTRAPARRRRRHGHLRVRLHADRLGPGQRRRRRRARRPRRRAAPLARPPAGGPGDEPGSGC